MTRSINNDGCISFFEDVNQISEIKIINVGRGYLPLLKLTPKLVWELRLSKIGGCVLPRGYGHTKPLCLNTFDKKRFKSSNFKLF